MSTRMKETALSLKEQLAGSRAGWYRRVRAQRHAIIRRHRAQAIVRVHLRRWPLLQPRTESVLSETAAAGASLVAISPEKPDDMLSTAEKNALTFEVPNDVGRALGLVYDFTDELKSAYRGFGLEIRFAMVRRANGRFPSRPPMSSIRMARPFTPSRMSTIAIVLIPATSSRP